MFQLVVTQMQCDWQRLHTFAVFYSGFVSAQCGVARASAVPHVLQIVVNT